MSWYEFLLRTHTEILERTLEHILLVAASMSIALAIGLPLGIYLVTRAALQRWVIGAANVALSLYALLPILRNTCIGIAEVDPAVVESARSMGMTSRQVLWQVQLPLAAPVLLAGVRVATAMCIGVTTIAAAIGAGGLGVFIFRGLAMVNNQVILAGAIPAACLAIAADAGLGYFQRSSARR